MTSLGKGVCVSRRLSLFASLLIVVLVSSVFTCVFVNSSSGTSLEDTVHVKNEDELKNAISSVPTGGFATITIDNDIKLTPTYENMLYHNPTIVIPTGKDVTLTSNSVAGFYKLIGASSACTLSVQEGGVLRIDGIIVTHVKGDSGEGVTVLNDGTLYLYSGEISGNTVNRASSHYSGDRGGGVIIYQNGTFIMSGGKISENAAALGGGVYNDGGFFVMTGGEISGNTADGAAGGVYNSGNNYPTIGNFELSGGKIIGNTANMGGGGVFNSGAFTVSGGEIMGNTARWGGGLYNTRVFDRHGGVISGNTATETGNDVYSTSEDSSNHSDLDDGGGFSNGGSSGSNGNNGGPSNGGGGSSNWSGYSLSDVIIICVSVVFMMVMVVVVLFLYFRRKVRCVEEKLDSYLHVV